MYRRVDAIMPHSPHSVWLGGIPKMWKAGPLHPEALHLLVWEGRFRQ